MSEVSLQLRAFGGCVVLRADGEPVPVTQPKRLALLAYLALARPAGMHRRDTLLGLLWPEMDDARARAALRQAVHHLRLGLGEGVIATRGAHELGVDDALLRSDVRGFESALAAGRPAEALERYAGPLLAGLYVDGGGAFDEWLQGERERLRRAAEDAAWTLAAQCTGAGNRDEAARWARCAAELAPYDEGALRRCMAAMADAGQASGALRLYRGFADRLRAELDVAPSAETRAAADALAAAPEPVPGPRAPMIRAVPVQDRHAPGAVADPAPAAAHRSATALAAAADPHSGRRRLRVPWGAAAVVLIAAVFVTLGWMQSAPPPDPRLVAVAGFRDRSGDPEIAAAVRELEEDIRQALGRSGAVRVVRASESGAPPRNAGRVVSGTVRRDGGRLHLRLTIHDRVQNTQTGGTGHSFATPAELRAAVPRLVDFVGMVLEAEADDRFRWTGAVSQPRSAGAFQAFARGLDRLHAEDGAGAAEAFRRSAAMDSAFTLPALLAAAADLQAGKAARADSTARALEARDGLAGVDRLLLRWLHASLAGDRPAALAAMRDLARDEPAMELAQFQLAAEAMASNRPREALAALGRIDAERGFSRGWASYWATRAEAHHMLGEHAAELRVVRAGRSAHPELRVLVEYEARALAAVGRGAEALRLLADHRAAPPAPGWEPGTALMHVGMELRAHGHPGPAKAAFTQAAAWYAARPAAAGPSAARRLELARAVLLAGDTARAAAVLADVLRGAPRCTSCAGALGVLAARRGRPAEARAADRRLAAVTGDEGAASMWRARIHAALGDESAAADRLREALASGYAVTPLLHTDPDLASPALARLLRPHE
ncbi:MAG TPA: BTAD domain-containing putative transcriptional regulator [Longimicrobium sp.]|jgi:serine/threonine-protein kinase|uniref:BTAD domain-containing putative transcriptional regulator n=1 Tax=Longimicrobium sp. TaxID=2029185 RepID=UPI002EDBAF9B